MFFRKAMNSTSLADLETPSDGRFYYPIEKRRSCGNVQALRQAEHRLDAFWQYVNDYSASNNADLHDFLDAFFGNDERKLQRTPERFEKTESAEIERTELPYVPFTQIDLNETSSRALSGEEKVKAKTGGVPDLHQYQKLMMNRKVKLCPNPPLPSASALRKSSRCSSALPLRNPKILERSLS